MLHKARCIDKVDQEWSQFDCTFQRKKYCLDADQLLVNVGKNVTKTVYNC